MSTLQVGFGLSEKQDLAAALDEVVTAAKEGVAKAQAAFITSTIDFDAEEVHAGFRARLPGVRLHGVTTSLGVLTSSGVKNVGNGALACMLLGGESQSFRTASSNHDDPRVAGREAAAELLSQADGRAPKSILFHASPGQEEAMLEGVAEIFPDVPCQGGSAADHAIAGQWWVFMDAGAAQSGLSLLGIYGDLNVGVGLVAPYAPTAEKAVVTAADDRQLQSIEGEPAASFLGRWLEGAIDRQVQSGGNILAQTALRPIATCQESTLGAHYTTIHAAQVHADSGAVDVFARVRAGDELTLMRGTADDLTTALPGLIDRALEHGGFARERIRAAFLIFCAGCAGALGPRLDEALATLADDLPADVPILGLCTFGEQGFVPGLGSVHQDLSMSVTLLAD